jgi:hypothetical protein
LIGPLCLELAMDPVQQARYGSIGDDGFHDFTPLLNFALQHLRRSLSTVVLLTTGFGA